MEYFEPIVKLCIFLFQLVGGVILVWGGIRTVYYFFLPAAYPLSKNKLVSLEELLRVEFGQKIVFALEFLVAGDVMATFLQPSVNEIYRLGLLVVIRTVLSFFVGREVKELDVHKHQIERELFYKNKKGSIAKR